MPARGSPYRRWLSGLELALSALVLVAFAVHAGWDVLDELALTVWFVAPVVLAVAALAGSGIDVYRLVTDADLRRSRWVLAGQLLAVGVVGALAAYTTWLVVSTILVVTVIDTGGGVIMGPLFWTLSGSVLAVAVLIRAVGTFFVDLQPVWEPATESPD